ncbi:MAG TPA: DUF2461 domain-containing protein, partial [Bacteroidota bacterium]
EGSGYYLHIEPSEVFLGGGIYIPDSDQLKRIRKAIASKPQDFLAVVRNPSLKRMFGSIEGDRLRRIPQGYDPGDPMADWLRLKQFFVGASFPVGKCHSPRFVDEVAKGFRVATPLVRFLNKALADS